MATPTIIIGIGSTGLHILENIQRFYYETYKKSNKPDNVELLYIETNENEKPTGTPIGNKIARAFINLDSIADNIDYIKKTCDNPEWLPDSDIVLNAGEGAGGMRSCGRLALWSKHHQGDNFMNVISEIKTAYSKVKNLANNDEEISKATVFVTGSLTGGTGSGIFIDIAYMVRDIIPGIKNLYGLFLVPNRPESLLKYATILGNTYGALKDLEYFNEINTSYKEKWPNGYTHDLKVPPFQLTQFISQDYQDGSPAISSLKGLVKMAGLYLFLNIVGIYEKRAKRLVDGFGNCKIGKYGTFGLSAIQFPKDQIQEYVSSGLSINLLSRLVNANEYYSGGQLRPIVRATIKQNIAHIWDTILEKAFASLNTVDQRDLLITLDRDSTAINKNEIKGTVTEHIISMFGSSRNDRYYASVSNNFKTAINVIIDEIHEQVNAAVESTENLYYAKYVLEDLIEAIDKTLKYWKSIGLSSIASNWDNELRGLATGCTQNTYKYIFEQDSVLKDRLHTIFELMKMHHAIRPLVDILNKIKDSDISVKGGTHELPRISSFSETIKKINLLIGDNRRNEDAKSPTASNEGFLNFKDRMKEIEADINDTTLPIQRVFPSNSFDQECKKGIQKFIQEYGGVRSMKEVVAFKNIWNYFYGKDPEKFNEEVYNEFLRAYQIQISEKNCVEDYDVTDFLKKNMNKSLITARRSISPFLRITKVLDPDPQIPRFIIGSKETSITEVVQAFNNNSFSYFPNHSDNICVLPDLKNILVFYDEKGNFDIVSQLEYVGLLKEAYEKVPANIQDKTMTQLRWSNGRNAYVKNHS